MPVYDHEQEKPHITVEQPGASFDDQPNSAVAETFVHNAEMLVRPVSTAVEDDRVVGRSYEGQRIFARPLILYVDATTGRIEGVGSHEKIAREKHMSHASGVATTVEAEATGVAKEVLDDPNIARIDAWFEQALLSSEVAPGEWRIQRPQSWVRNDRIRLSERSLTFTPLEQALPEDIERGMFLKSIADHNAREESAVFVPDPRDVA